MTDILGLTTTDAIRAVWGLSAKDMSDTKFATFDLPLALEVELEEMGISYDAVVAGKENDKKEFYHLSQFSLYFCAKKISSSVNLSAAQSVSDGNVAGRRFGETALERAIEVINAKFVESYNALAQTFSLTALVAPSFVGKSTPEYDPVIGEG